MAILARSWENDMPKTHDQKKLVKANPKVNAELLEKGLRTHSREEAE